MYQSLTETAQEVKCSENKNTLTQFLKLDSVRKYTARQYQDIIPALSHRSEADCAATIRMVGEINWFPGGEVTNKLEAARFFDIEPCALNRRLSDNRYRARNRLSGFTETGTFTRSTVDMLRTLETNFPDAQTYISCNGVYVENKPGVAMYVGSGRSRHNIYLTAKGVIALAYQLANGKSEDDRCVAKRLVDACEETGLFDKPQHGVKPTQRGEPPVPQEPPKLDPTQTLTQMFQAMLTLLTKESEERGAEKLIQKLKEEGKL